LYIVYIKLKSMRKIIFQPKCIRPITSLLLLFLGFNSFAQSVDSLEARYNKENIVRTGSGSFMKGGVKLSFADMSEEFNKSALGLELYLAARKSKTNATIFNSIAIASIVAAPLSVNRNTQNYTASYILLGAGALFGILGGASLKRYMAQIDQALDQRNRQVLFH
jgi:hypothetical protein